MIRSTVRTTACVLLLATAQAAKADCTYTDEARTHVVCDAEAFRVLTDQADTCDADLALCRVGLEAATAVGEGSLSPQLGVVLALAGGLALGAGAALALEGEAATGGTTAAVGAVAGLLGVVLAW